MAVAEDPASAASPPSWLVTIDGSATSDAALQRAIDIARSTGVQLSVLSVSEDLAHRPSMYMLSIDTARTLQRELDAHAQGLLDAALAGIAEGVQVTPCFRRGSPGETILDEIAREGHELVIMGARGAGAAKSRFGSVARHVLFRAQVPVVVVPFTEGAVGDALGPGAAESVV